jgi:hypothetical protein
MNFLNKTCERQLLKDASFSTCPAGLRNKSKVLNQFSYGFNALKEYDRAGFGGNSDGQVSQQDAIFNQLRLWRDLNHNDISESSELHTPAELGLRKIDLDYRESRRVDEFGNQFKYRAKVKDA